MALIIFVYIIIFVNIIMFVSSVVIIISIVNIYYLNSFTDELIFAMSSQHLSPDHDQNLKLSAPSSRVNRFEAGISCLRPSDPLKARKIVPETAKPKGAEEKGGG
eukprot:768749-Hanusia_phi.AAC.3